MKKLRHCHPTYIGSVTAQHSSIGVSQTLRRGTRNGITELSQTAPPIFGWAAITLGIGPHSSLARNITQIVYRYKPERGPMPNVMAAMPNTGGAHCLADGHYCSAVQ